jgi:hypothetical protein
MLAPPPRPRKHVVLRRPFDEPTAAAKRCTAGFRSGLCRFGVIRVGSTRYRPSRYVRFAPIATKFGRCGETSFSAISGLMHCSKKSSYSITSLAAACSVSGTVRPSAFAVFKLITRSNLVICITGKSPGLAPLRILPTYTAAWRCCSLMSAP